MTDAVKHTPGPWVRDGFNLSSVFRCTAERGSPDAKHTCGDYETVARCEGPNWLANSFVITAAPEMLAVLHIAMPQNICVDNSNVSDDFVVPVDFTMGELRKIASVIAKAEGR